VRLKLEQAPCENLRPGVRRFVDAAHL
jgi:hypothetical protein